jgi:hypothetical protein
MRRVDVVGVRTFGKMPSRPSGEGHAANNEADASFGGVLHATGLRDAPPPPTYRRGYSTRIATVFRSSFQVSFSNHTV